MQVIISIVNQEGTEIYNFRHLSNIIFKTLHKKNQMSIILKKH